MTTTKAVSQDLKPNRVMKNTRDLEKILRSIEENMNHFNREVTKDILYNIGTGKSSKQEAAEPLLNVNKIGQKAREGFIIPCMKDPKRFEECVPHHKILNFASKGASYSLTGANKLMTVEMVRNFFGSILFWLFEGKLIWQRLPFPLTPTPLSLSHAEETMLKTQKSKLMEELESRIFSEKPNHVDVTITDAMFFLHLWKDLPATFGTIARFLLIKSFA